MGSGFFSHQNVRGRSPVTTALPMLGPGPPQRGLTTTLPYPSSAQPEIGPSLRDLPHLYPHHAQSAHAILSLPHIDARCNGVKPALLRAFTLSLCSSNNRATLEFPFRDAMCNGVSLPYHNPGYWGPHCAGGVSVRPRGNPLLLPHAVQYSR